MSLLFPCTHVSPLVWSQYCKCIWRSSLDGVVLPNTPPDSNLSFIFSIYCIYHFVFYCWAAHRSPEKLLGDTRIAAMYDVQVIYGPVSARCRTEGLSAKPPWLCECMNVLLKQLVNKCQRITVYHPRCERTRHCLRKSDVLFFSLTKIPEQHWLQTGLKRWRWRI